MEYLGHKIGNGQLAVPTHRIAAMREYKKPKTKKDMRAFLVSSGYYRRFVKNFVESSAVFTPKTSSKAPGKVIWNPEMDEAFAKLCVSLCDMCVSYMFHLILISLSYTPMQVDVEVEAYECLTR